MRLFQHFAAFRFLAPDTPGGTGDKPADKPEEKPADKPDPTAAELAELRRWRQEREAADAKAAEAKKAADDAEALKRGEHEKVLGSTKAERDELKAKLEVLEKREKARLKAIADENAEALKALPKEIAELAPDYDDPDKMAAWIKRAAKGVKPEPEGGVGGHAGRPASGEKIPDWVTKMAGEYGADPKAFYETMVKTKRVSQPPSA